MASAAALAHTSPPGPTGRPLRFRRKARNTMDRQQVALFTSWGHGHRHTAIFGSEKGNGATTDDHTGHVHAIRGLEVLPAAGHTHELSAVRAFMPPTDRRRP
jgi:hypothetical protein